MAKKKKPDAVEAPEVFDVAGQLGGPSAEEQAMVDAEQLVIIEQMANARRAIEAEAVRQMAAREAAVQAARKRQVDEINARFEAIEKRLDALEARLPK